MIKNFKCVATQTLFQGKTVTGFPAEIQKRARRKLIMLDSARQYQDLRPPPGNRLEKLSGDREGQSSIRINDQWRICFTWKDGDAYGVEIVDYH